MYMSWLVNLSSFSAPMRVCICLDVLRSALKPSWLSCRMLCVSLYEDNMVVKVFVYNLSMVLARAMDLWFVSI